MMSEAAATRLTCRPRFRPATPRPLAALAPKLSEAPRPPVAGPLRSTIWPHGGPGDREWSGRGAAVAPLRRRRASAGQWRDRRGVLGGYRRDPPRSRAAQ